MGILNDLISNLGGIVTRKVDSSLFSWMLAISGAVEGSTSLVADSFLAKNVVSTNVASLSAYTVTSASTNDNVTNVAGDVVLLVAQTTPSQNGPYVVGAVTGTTAPLTRPVWWSTGTVFKTGVTIGVGSLGTVFKNTNWQAMRAANATFTVDTNDPELYPVQLSFQVQLTTGSTGAIAAPIRSLKTGVAIGRTTANTSAATIMYAPTVGGATGLVAGVMGVGSVTVEACVAAGTKNAADISTLNITIFNQAA
jgi:hypothetical protein